MSTHNTPYSPYKLVHHQDRLDDIKNGDLPVPLQVQLIISDLCNHDCNFCAYRLSGYTSNQLFGVKHPETGEVNNNPNRRIPTDKVFEILEDCAELGVKAIQYTGGGEPTVHKDYVEIFKKTADLGMDIALVTNGSRLSDEAIDVLVKHGKWVRFSIDAGTAETYSSIRDVNIKAYDRTMKNVQRLIDARNAAEKSDLIIGMGFVVTEDNWREVGKFINNADKMKVDNVRISAVFSNDEAEVHNTYAARCDELIQYMTDIRADSDMKIFNMFSKRVDDLKEGSPEYKTCTYMKLNVYIGGDLNVYSCCNNAYNLQGLMGSIKDQSFKDFWTAPDTQKKYHNYDATTCKRCMFNTKNRFANYLLEEDPVHVNYI